MKNLLYVLLFMMGVGTVSAQDLPTKYATFELFTNIPCPACQSASPSFKTRLKNSPGPYHLISFYPGRPYSTCPLYQLNTSENKTRLAHYPNIFGSPRVVVGGTDVMHPNSLDAPTIAAAQGGTSWLEVDVDENSGDSRTVTVNPKVWETPTNIPTTKLYAVVVQKFIFVNGAPGGYTDHDEVFMKFLSDPNGDVIDLNDAGITTYTYDLEADWDDDNTYVVAWVMDEDTKEIINSGTKFDADFSSIRTIDKESIEVKVFPNPASDLLNIVLPARTEVSSVKVSNSSGQQSVLSYEDKDSQLEVNISELAKGNYILLLETKEGVVTKKFTKI